jgi:hypothetical protein
MKKGIRLYNVLFPIWFLFLFPQLWLIMLPVNFIVDSLVLYLTARRQGLEHRFGLWKKRILPIWGIGFLSDLIGAAAVVILYFGWCELDILGITMINPILFPGTTLMAMPGVALAGWLIYILNKKITFRKSDLDPAIIHKLCLHLAIWTAPYTMLIPLYG